MKGFFRYRVVCSTWREYLEARKVMSINVTAEVIFEPRSRINKIVCG